jgi:PAS domain S-box-containing protein
LQVAAGVSQKTSNETAPQDAARNAIAGRPRSRPMPAAAQAAEVPSEPEDRSSLIAHFLAPRLAGLALGGALAALLVAMLLVRGPFSAVQILVVLGAALGLLSVHLALWRRARDAHDLASVGLKSFGARLERRLEQLQDAQWELNENESRYRALLDAQEDMILRRDAQARLTFVNRSFLHTFGVAAEQVLGKPFNFDACDAEGPAPLSTTDEVRQKRFIRQVHTATGPRWIEWEEQLVPAADGASLEVQSVGRDITDKRLVEVELAEARDQAEAANRAKSRFLAAMSHEIRTPMNGILGMASLLLETQQTPEQQTYAHAIDQSARTLLALIDEILDFSKIEAGKLELNEAPFALETCVQGVVELLAPRAHEKGLEVAWSVDPELPRLVAGDETRVRQILLNLLSNAVKFTDRGGVCVNAVASRGLTVRAPSEVVLEIDVEDTGIGMSQEDMHGLFAEFEQADTAVRRSDGGTGLGLAISMQLARAMGGDIRVVSAPGKGSTFTVDLVLRQMAPVLAEDADRGMVAELGRVLLAFDRPLERRALSYALASSRIPAEEVDFAAAASALEMAAGNGEPFDRIVIDGAQGAAAAGHLLARARELNPHATVRGIVLVNVLARASLSEFRAAGFDAYLVRPVRPASMMMQLGLRGGRSLDHGETAHGGESSGLNSSIVAPQRHVLLAEDNEINALLARRVLEKCGCDYVAVTNGQEAVAAVRRSLEGDAPPLDLVLMDIFMPQLDGIEAAREIKRLYASCAEAASPPIVALTASAFAEDKKRYLEAGMDDYLAKPFDKASLEAVLKRWFGRAAGGDKDAAA